MSRPLAGSCERSDSFETFVAQSGDRLLRLAVVVVSDVADGEDLYQECLRRVAARWDQIDNPTAYSRQVIRNLSIDRARQRQRRNEVVVHDIPAVADRRAADALDATEVRTALFAALASLSAEQRVVVALRYLEDLGEVEVAGQLGLPVGTVKSTASRALARLRRHHAIAHFFLAEAAS